MKRPTEFYEANNQYFLRLEESLRSLTRGELDRLPLFMALTDLLKEAVEDGRREMGVLGPEGAIKTIANLRKFVRTQIACGTLGGIEVCKPMLSQLRDSCARLNLIGSAPR